MLYNAFATILLVLASPFLALLSLRAKFKKSIPARFFLIGNKKLPKSEIYFHACSLGEVNTISKLALKFDDVKISVTTQTGFNEAKKHFKNVAFLPFEPFLGFWITDCKKLIVFEAELWLNLFKICKKNGSKTILLNARISDKSYKNYLRFRFYYKILFKNVDLVLAQSKLDEKRLRMLGANNIKVVGNIKSAFICKQDKIYKKPDKRVILIASSHNFEEKILLENLKFDKEDQIFIAPRHPERFDEVWDLILKFGSKFNLSCEKFSQNLGFLSDIVLIDTLGELVNFYAISDIVFLCGSFVEGIGGHNPMEPASFNVRLVSGPFFHNQKSLYESVGGIKIVNISSLPAILDENLEKSYVKNMANLDEILDEIRKI